MHFTPGWQGFGTQEGRGWLPPIPGSRNQQLCVLVQRNISDYSRSLSELNICGISLIFVNR